MWCRVGEFRVQLEVPTAPTVASQQDIGIPDMSVWFNQSEALRVPQQSNWKKNMRFGMHQFKIHDWDQPWRIFRRDEILASIFMARLYAIYVVERGQGSGAT